MAWKSEWNGDFFERVRGFGDYFNEAEMIITELKNRGVNVELYKELWKEEKERVKFRSENYWEYARKEKALEFLKIGRKWTKKLRNQNKESLVN